MMDNQNPNNSNPLGDLFSSIKCYVDLRIDEIKLALAENLAKIFSRIIFFFLLFILVGVVLGIAAAALASWFTVLVGNRTAGLLITAGLFVLIILVLFLFKDRFLINSPLRMFLRMFFDTESPGAAVPPQASVITHRPPGDHGDVQAALRMGFSVPVQPAGYGLQGNSLAQPFLQLPLPERGLRAQYHQSQEEQRLTD